MNIDALRQLLEELQSGQVGIDHALMRLRALPFERLEFASIDHHRALRCGFPEVIFCQSKSPAHVVEIARRLAGMGNVVLGTRASGDHLEAVRAAFGEVEVNTLARTFLLNGGAATPAPRPSAAPSSADSANAAAPPAVHASAQTHPRVAVVSAGTADGAVAEEAAFTLRAMGVPVLRITDAGVAGLHRLLPHVSDLQQCCAVVAIAGMEGALPSVVGGLVACPVFAVPTSVGYGTSFGGLTALLAMLNSCAANVSVVNIDNGFGAAISSALVFRQATSAVR